MTQILNYNIPLYQYLVLSLILFLIGILGLVLSKNFIRLLISLELILNAVCINFIAFSNYLDDSSLLGMTFAAIIVLLAAIEVSLIVGLIILLFKGNVTQKQIFEKNVDGEKND